MNNLNEVLSTDDIGKIRKLASEKRAILDYSNSVPIASDLLMILDKLDMHLIECPIKSVSGHNAFSAVLLCNYIDNQKHSFLGLNTANPLTQQLFAIAHELYHYFTEKGTDVCKDSNENQIEIKANRFAAEFLLPLDTFLNILYDEFDSTTLKGIGIPELLRFISRIHCRWWLPYKSIVKRLKEADAITNEQFEILFQQDVQGTDSDFTKICLAINSEIYNRLNLATNKIGTSAKNIETIIKNYENGLLDDDAFINTLRIFGIDPSSFGYDFRIDKEDYDEIKNLLTQENPCM